MPRTTQLPIMRAVWLGSLALAAVFALATADRGAAAQVIDSDPVLGTTAPSGAFRDSRGALWVSDHAGLCRVNEGVHAPGAGLIDSPYCDPTGLANPPRIGPAAPGQAAYDRNTGFVYIGDGASNSGGVWRFHLSNADPSVVDAAVLIVDYSNPLVRDRVFGMSYDPGHKWLDFATKNSATILRIQDPQTCPNLATAPPNPCIPVPVGAATASAAPSLAHDADANLYIADGPAVTRIPVNSLGTAAPVAGLNLGTYTTVTFDPNHGGGMIYAGTTNAEGVDWVDALRIPTGQTATYAVGFDGVTAVAVRDSGDSGDLDVLDDPGVKQVGEDLGGTGRLFRVPFEMFAPAPTIVDAPLPVSNGRVTTFGFTYPSNVTFWCALDQAPPTTCGAGTSSLVSYANVTHGSHTFQVFADSSGGPTLPTSAPRTIRRFTIDARAPVVQIDELTVAGQDVTARFSADDLNVDFTCRMDTAPPALCDSPARFKGLSNGIHTLVVSATDFVGNAGPSVTREFRVGPEPAPPWKPGKVVATLNGNTLTVAFNAPPTGRYASFVMTKKGMYPVRTKPARVRAGRRNTITVVLSRAEANRLQRTGVTLKVVAGATKSTMSIASGSTKLKIKTPRRAGGR